MKIQQQEWNAQHARGLARALDSSVLAIVEDEVNRGVSKLWLCTSDQHRALCVTRVDENPRELVIVAFEGTGTLEFIPTFMAVAKAMGIPVRAHVTSEFVARLVRPLGFKPREVVLVAAA